MKVAFATHDRKTVDAHFGSARTFLIYEIGPDSHHLAEAVEFDSVSDEGGSHDDGEDRLEAKIEALTSVSLLFVLAIGGPAAARVIRAKVHPIKLPQPETIPDAIARIQGMLNGTPPPWLRKVIQAGSPQGGGVGGGVAGNALEGSTP